MTIRQASATRGSAETMPVSSAKTLLGPIGLDCRSAFFEGFVRHRRRTPRGREFTYRMFLVYLDLDELPEVLDRLPLWSGQSPALAFFRRSDYLGAPRRPLRDAISDRVAEETGVRPRGPIRMLTHLRYFGYCFNPVTFYYCFDPSGDHVETIVAEIENTPWGERHAYVLDARSRPNEDRGGFPDPPRPRRTETHRQRTVHRFRFHKAFHVSPFQSMDLDYDWRFREPGERISIHMRSHENGSHAFDVTLALQRVPMTRLNGALLLAKYPFLTLRTVMAIYWQALRLRLRGFRFYSHPSKRRATKEILSR